MKDVLPAPPDYRKEGIMKVKTNVRAGELHCSE